MTDQQAIPAKVRSFVPGDAEVCKRLYMEALVGGKIADNDTGVDMDDIPDAYMSTPGGHFWVAENDGGEVVGMIGVQHLESGEGEVRRLRVREDHRNRGIGGTLVETALRFCQEKHHLKVVLDTFMDREMALRLFEKFRFRHSRTRELGGKTVLYFYLDLYSSGHPGPPKPS